MIPSRRQFLQSAAAATLLAAPPALATASPKAGLLDAAELVALFDGLPGQLSFRILVPGFAGSGDFVAEFEPARRLFAASAIKTFALCEVLRQHDSADVKKRLEERQLALDSSIWSLGSPTFNPPGLAGEVSARTVLEAMITRSDNTATDMAFKLAGVANIRDLIAAAGLTHTSIPDSTRAFTAYLWGAPDYRDIGWEELLRLIEGPMVHPFLNDEQSLASSAGDFVSYYAKALQGGFFEHPETLDEFRRVLTLCDYIYLIPLPLGMSAYAKSGNADMAGFHARTIAGGMECGGRWAYFAFLLNWDAQEAADPATVDAFFAAINQALTRVRDALATTGAPPPWPQPPRPIRPRRE
ncbi:MAG: serine hydrolase [Xanthomonadales bacterium]|nr:serine hydrolase [Xanthomonadales bacterium]